MGLSPSNNLFLGSATQRERSAIEVTNRSEGILGSRVVSFPEKKEPLVDYKDRLEGHTQECFASRPGRLGGLVYMFKAKAGADRVRFPHDPKVTEQLEALRQKAYPAIEGNMLPESNLPPNEGAPILPALEYRRIKGENGTYATYPDPEALHANWNEIRTNPQHEHYKPNLPEIKIQWGDGIASDRDFVYSYLEYDALLSSGKEFIHDQDLHVKHILYFAWTDPEMYKKYRAWHVGIFRKVAECLDAKAARGADETYLKEMWFILGKYVDEQSNYHGSNSISSYPAFKSMFFSGIDVEFWKKRMGEFPDTYQLETLWRGLLGECLTPEESWINYRPVDEQTGISVAAQYGNVAYLRFLLEKLKGKGDRWLREEFAKPTNGKFAPPFVAAAQNNHLECLNLLIEHGADVDQRYAANGTTALIVASERGQYESVKWLIASGAKLNLTTNEGANAVFQAALFGRSRCLKLLLDNRVEVDCVRFSDNSTPLLMAAEKGYTECVKLLLEHGANPNRYCLDEEVTPFFIAVQNGHKDCVELFLNNGGTPNNICANKRVTALQLAKDLDRVDCVEILEKAQAASER